MRSSSRWQAAMAVAVLGLLVAVAACGGGGGGQAVASGEIKIEAGEFYLKPAAVTVKVGTPVKFVVTNAGKIEHEFAFEGLVAKGIAAKIEGIMPGTTKTLEITFTEPGTYEFGCHLPGHFEAGMKGTVTVVR